MTDQKFKVRDTRQKDFYFIENQFLRGGYGRVLGPYGIAVYNALAVHAGHEDQDAWPSYHTIANLTGMSRRQAIRKIQELVSLNIVKKNTRIIEGKESNEQTSNEYILLARTEWKPVTTLVTHSHQGSDCESSPLVTVSHQGSDCESPKQDSPNETQKEQSNPLSSKKYTNQQILFGYLAEVCRISLENGFMTDHQELDLNSVSKKFDKAGITSKQIDQFGQWWFTKFRAWQEIPAAPTPKQVLEFWGQFEESNKSNNGNSKYTPEQLEAIEYLNSQDK